MNLCVTWNLKKAYPHVGRTALMWPGDFQKSSQHLHVDMGVFFGVCVCPALGCFSLLSCVWRTMSNGSECSAVGQLLAGREGLGRDGMREEAALCGYILFD